jgi:anaerobic selenocysteine-containing dehydrogenase
VPIRFLRPFPVLIIAILLAGCSDVLAADLNLKAGRPVKVATEAGSEEIELEITDTARKGHVAIPHGFGLVYNGVKYGANVNRLTKNTHRDQFGTPIHRYVPCRVEVV